MLVDSINFFSINAYQLLHLPSLHRPRHHRPFPVYLLLDYLNRIINVVEYVVFVLF